MEEKHASSAEEAVLPVDIVAEILRDECENLIQRMREKKFRDVREYDVTSLARQMLEVSRQSKLPLQDANPYRKQSIQDALVFALETAGVRNVPHPALDELVFSPERFLPRHIARHMLTLYQQRIHEQQMQGDTSNLKDDLQRLRTCKESLDSLIRARYGPGRMTSHSSEYDDTSRREVEATIALQNTMKETAITAAALVGGQVDLVQMFEESLGDTFNEGNDTIANLCLCTLEQLRDSVV